ARGRGAGAPALPILGPRAPRWPRRPPARPRARAGPAGVAAAPRRPPAGRSCPESEVRHQIRGRLDDAGCVAPPRNSANYSSSSRASAADPPPTSATDFGSGTLALGWLRARRPPHAIGGQDDHLPIVALALAPRRNGGIALQGQVDHAP